MKMLFFMGLLFSSQAFATTANIWSPANGSAMPNNTWATFSGDAQSSNGILEVKYYLNGGLYCTVKSAPFNCSYLSGNNNGTYTLKMVATDRSYASSEKTIQFFVGSVSPTPAPATTAIIPSINFMEPKSGASLGTEFWTTLTSTATNAVSVKYYANGSPVCEATTGPYFNCSYKTPASATSVVLKAVVTSSTGHTAEKSATISVGGGTVAPTPTPSPTTAVIPVLNFMAPKEGANLDTEFWTTLTSTATNAVSVKYYANGAFACEAKTGPYYNCSYKTPASNASVILKAVVTSSSGHTAEKSITISVGSGTTVTPPPTTVGVIPALNFMAPKDGSALETDFWTTLTSTATNAVSVKYYANGVFTCEAKTGPYYNCSYKTPSSGATVNLKAVVTSSTGNTAEKSINVIIGSGTVTTSPPTTTPTPTPTPTPGTSAGVPVGYKLFWKDEFDNNHNGAPNPEWWDYDVNYVRNNEAQCYTDNRRENVRVENRTMEGSANGYLVLELRKEAWPCKQGGNNTFQYTSGSITTRKRGWAEHLVNMPHGRYEIRAKIPSGRGTWPAIWLVGSSDLGSWPNSGEIDIMEAVGYDEAAGKYVLYSTLHRQASLGWPNKWGTTGQGFHYLMQEPPSARFHTWVMEWTPTSIEIFVDGNRVTKLLVAGDALEERLGFFRSEFANTGTAMGWPYANETPGHKWEFILNLAHGGEWGGVKGLDDTIFANGKKVEMLVDYVRVYTKE